MVATQTLGQTSVMRRVFLTGASSGIGLAIAKLLVEEGHEVWGTSRNLERIPKMPRCHPVRLDLTDPLSVEAAFNAARSNLEAKLPILTDAAHVTSIGEQVARLSDDAASAADVARSLVKVSPT